MKAVFWDNDGVLVETEHLFFRASREVLAGVDVELDEARFVDLSLRRGESVLDLARERGLDDAGVERLRRARNERYAELLRAGVEVLAGVEEALRALHGRVPMAVVTSSYRDHFELIHRGTGLLGFFDFVLASGDYARHKPHPEPYLRAAERLGVEPRDCVVVEDSERGVQAAVGAGMRCLAVPGPLTRAGDFSRADRVLGSAREIVGVLGLGNSGADRRPQRPRGV